MSDETVSIDKAAIILGVSNGTISRMVKRGDLRGMKLISDRAKGSHFSQGRGGNTEEEPTGY